MRIFIIILSLLAFADSSFATENNDLKRGGKRKFHEVEDRYCTNITEKNCYAKNTNNKIEEAKDKSSKGSNN